MRYPRRCTPTLQREKTGEAAWDEVFEGASAVVIVAVACVERMPFGRFLLLTTAGSLLWNTAFVVAGHSLGESSSLVDRYASMFQYAVLAAVAIAVSLVVAVRVRRVSRR